MTHCNIVYPFVYPLYMRFMNRHVCVSCALLRPQSNFDELILVVTRTRVHATDGRAPEHDDEYNDDDDDEKCDAHRARDDGSPRREENADD